MKRLFGFCTDEPFHFLRGRILTERVFSYREDSLAFFAFATFAGPSLFFVFCRLRVASSFLFFAAFVWQAVFLFFTVFVSNGFCFYILPKRYFSFSPLSSAYDIFLMLLSGKGKGSALVLNGRNILSREGEKLALKRATYFWL